MLKEQSRLLQQSLFAVDLLLISVAWVLAWVIRFELLVPPAYVPLGHYLGFLPAVLVIWAGVFLLSGLYDAQRAQQLPLIAFGVARAIFFGVIASVVAMFFYRAFYFSRLHMLLFGLISSGLLVILRIVIYSALREARRRGKNLRRVLIVGAGRAGRKIAEAFRSYPWMGFEVVGFLDDDARVDGEILGSTSALPEIMDSLAARGRSIDFVYVALPAWAHGKIESITRDASSRLAHVAFVPDLFQFDIILNHRISEVGGLPVIHLVDETPYDLPRAVKRTTDILFSAGVLILLSPLLIALAIGVKLSSPGPVFYRQTRMGLNGHTFEMLKFRSMPVTAEATTGAVWASKDESRATPFGAFLRRTSLDELPQFINVLKGDMAIVGPRPERPVFIKQFKEGVPNYMLRHKMKAGITGWAQVNGWRGNTSIERRIEYDLYYIQNWSLMLDVKIMWMTIFKGFVHENAY
jgi:putative colanic acid biosysnthesis UDP-glucose lipid carrier transferase